MPAVLPENPVLAYQTKHRASFKLKCSHQLCAKLISFLLYLFAFCTHSHIFYIPKNNVKFQFSQFSHSVVSSSVNPWTAAHFPVHHQLPELAQIHVHQVSDAIQASHPLSSPPPAFNLSQHQDLFELVCSLHQVSKVLEFQLQHQSFQ